MKYGIKDLYWYDTDDNKYHKPNLEGKSSDETIAYNILRVAVRCVMEDFLNKTMSLEKCNEWIEGYKRDPGKYHFEVWE